MFIPAHYEQGDPDVLRRLIRSHPWASIVTARNRTLDATHIPLMTDPRAKDAFVLIGHVDRNNPLFTEAEPAERVLVIVRGFDGYITPNWYPGKLRDENQAPTWNYEVANLQCDMDVIDDEKFVRGCIAKLVTQQEADQPKPWKMTDSDKEFIDENLKKVVGVRLVVRSWSSMYKLSQNRNQEDFLGAVDGLRSAGETRLADEMIRHYPG